MARLRVFDEDSVLDKAIEIFWNKGYNGTSAQNLVTHLGLSRSSLYDSFGDKRSLFIKALEQYQKRSLDNLSSLLNGAENVKQTINFIFAQAVAESFGNNFNKGCFMVNSSIELAIHDVEIANIVSQNRQKTEAIFLSAIKKGQEAGQISNVTDARMLARFIYNNYLGIRVMARSNISDKQVFDDVLKVISATL